MIDALPVSLELPEDVDPPTVRAASTAGDVLEAARFGCFTDLGPGAVVDAVGDHRPAKVASGANDVDLGATRRTVLVLPELAGDRMQRRALRIPVAVTVDLRPRIRLVHERIV